MIPYNKIRTEVAKGLAEHLRIKMIRTNQAAPAPAYPYGCYTVTTIATANNGTWQQHEDGIDRKQVRMIMSLSFLSDDSEQSVELAINAREWLEHTGRIWLKDRGITVQSTTDVANRDNFLTSGYEHKQGFDVVFYAYDEVGSTTEATGYIEAAEVSHEVLD